MDDEFDYRAELAEVDEYCSYLDTIYEEELLASWRIILRTKDYVLLQNQHEDIRLIKASYINNLLRSN